MFFVCLILTFCQVLVCVYSGELIKTKLYDELFENRKYNPGLIPICNKSFPVDVEMNLALRELIKVDEKMQIVTLGVWFKSHWYDCRLKWNPANFSDVSLIVVPYDHLWIPDLTMFDSSADEVMYPDKEMYNGEIRPDGEVTYNFPTVIKTVCHMDVKYFPFDTQTCEIVFGSWSHHGFELDLHSLNNATEGDLNAYVKHNEWTIVSMHIVRNVVIYNCCPEPYPDIAFHLVLRRKSKFYVLTTLFPVGITGSVATTGFILPPESGEKVSLTVTVLLSLAVFMLMVSEQLPASADSNPYIGLYFASSMTLVAMSCFMMVLVLNIHYRGNNGRPVPRIVRYIIIDKLGYLLCAQKELKRYKRSRSLHAQKPTIVEPDDNFEEETTGKSPLSPNGINAGEKPTMEAGQDFLSQTSPMADFSKSRGRISLVNLERNAEWNLEMNDILAEWHQVAFVMDRFFLVFYILSTVLASVVFFVEMSTGDLHIFDQS